jgi:NAD(P)H-hydrate epimerase
MTRIAVVAASEAAARDRATIEAGVPSRALMQRAGAAAAGEIVRRHGDRLANGVAVHGGPGNNGGDAWVVARALAALGVRVAAVLHGDAPRTDDARFEHAAADALGVFRAPTGREALLVDGVLGTGARRDVPGFVDAAIAEIEARRAGGATVVALDVPTGVDATTRERLGERAVRADLTLTFGTMKRGLLVARELAGTIAVLDIGLLDAVHDDVPRLVDASDVARVVPPIGASAHKGTRGKVAIVGGAAGMAGATLLAAEAALRSGAGMVRVVAAPESVAVAQTVLPEALAAAWPTTDDEMRERVTEWADVVLLGPGLGRADVARDLCDRVLGAWRGPVVLDADAVTLHADRVDALAALLRGRPALLTPHPVEFGRLAGMPVADVLAQRFDVGQAMAARLGAAVLLKGVPTFVSDGGHRLVSAAGTPALATGGSGDVLGGIAAALLAAHDAAPSALDAGAVAAWVHGRAGEIATARRGGVRGTTLRDVLAALSDVWHEAPPAAPYPVLVELPVVPE